MVEKQVDILIVGGGLIGATLMLALQGLGFSTLLVESQAFSDKLSPDFDARSLALSPASIRILNTLGIWELLKEYATPIDKIHVSEQSRFGLSQLQGNENEPLGYVIEIQHIQWVLQQLLSNKSLREHLISPATLSAFNLEEQSAAVTTPLGEMSIKAKLIVAADGTESPMRKYCNLSVKSYSYDQQAIVANVGLMKAHQHCAYERFTREGPLAFLPMQENRMSLIWAMSPKRAKLAMQWNDATFLRELQQAFGYRLGRLVKIGKRFSYPLKQVIMPQQTKGAIVFVGNAAHTLHPVAGQGFNLGLRDIATLAQCISEQGLNKRMLEHYLQLRRHDQQRMTHFTDGLIQLFTTGLPGMGLFRSMALIAMDTIPLLKNNLTRYAAGFGGISPDLVCEIKLRSRQNEPSI